MEKTFYETALHLWYCMLHYIQLNYISCCTPHNSFPMHIDIVQSRAECHKSNPHYKNLITDSTHEEAVISTNEPLYLLV